MFALGKSFFDSGISIPTDCDIVFVSDMFLEDYVGGAELTSDALLASCPLNVFKLHSKDVTLERLQEGHRKFWIFGNYASLNPDVMPSIIGNMKYSVVEYDYKFCKYRSLEKHLAAEGSECNCSNDLHGKLISSFLMGARSLWWMSEKQFETHAAIFPFLRDNKNTILSSVFDTNFFATIKILREQTEEKAGWIVMGSPSWIKGTDDAVAWCQLQGLTEKVDASRDMRQNEYEVVWNIPYSKILEKLSKAEGLVFFPKGADTCPRLVIEAKLLGCKLQLNDNVQHKNEIWFDTDDLLDTESYLYLSAQRFWNGIKADMTYAPSISGYTTTLNCIKQGYPYEESIKSMLGFCEQVVAVDGGSTDGTWEHLLEMATIEPKLVVVQRLLDMSDTRFARFDGEQKAYARSLCTGTYCWQQDSDEIVHENDYEKVRIIASDFPATLYLLSLPVIEYWGGSNKVRMDIYPWKWRLSKNHPSITHGIPASLRTYDSEGRLHALPGTDGCDYVNAVTFDPVPNATFYTVDVENARQKGMTDPAARHAYNEWFKMMATNLPTVHHYSWYDLGRKIRTYRDYWSKHWQSLYNIVQEDTAENNMFFDAPWSEVSEEQIDELAKRLASEFGGWVFHRKIDFSNPTPSLTPISTYPAIIQQWLAKHETK